MGLESYNAGLSYLVEQFTHLLRQVASHESGLERNTYFSKVGQLQRKVFASRLHGTCNTILVEYA